MDNNTTMISKTSFSSRRSDIYS